MRARPRREIRGSGEAGGGFAMALPFSRKPVLEIVCRAGLIPKSVDYGSKTGQRSHNQRSLVYDNGARLEKTFRQNPEEDR
jgi:hypothetical protein